MNRIAKIVLIAIAALLVALLAGWIWGSSGRASIRAQLSDTQLRLALSEATSHALRGQVDILQLNFGQAARDFDAAKRPVQEAAARLDEAGHKDQGDRARQALAQLGQAQAMAARLERSPNAAAQAVSTLDAVMSALPPAPAPPK